MKNHHAYETMAVQLDAEVFPGLDTMPAGDAKWPSLEPLEDGLSQTVEPFPFHAMGTLLGGAAQAIAEGVQAPDSLAGGSVLAAASLAVQPLANVVLPHGQRAPLSLYIITSGESGDRKSGVDRVACAPIEKRRKQQARDYQRQMEAFRHVQTNAKKGELEPPPAMQALTVGDATIQGIAKLLRSQSSVGVFSQDGGDVLGGHSMQDKNRMATMAFFLKGWGGESVDTLRAGDGLTSLVGRRIAMHVMVQPVLLRQLLGDPLAAGQGFLARCLIAEPCSLAGSRFYREANLEDSPGPAITAYHDRLQHLLNVCPTIWPGGDGYELKPRNLPLSTEAKAVWPGLHDAFEREQATGKELEAARAFAAKAMEHLARIAGVLTVFNNPDSHSIALAELQGAAHVVRFYVNEHLRLTGSGRSYRAIQAIHSLLNWLQREAASHRGMVDKKSVLQRSPREVRNLKAEGINPLLEELQRRGYIREAGKAWEVRTDV